MRYLGWILGGLWMADGITAVAARRSAWQWTRRALAPKLAGKGVPKDEAVIEQRMVLAMGITNILAGAGMAALASTLGRKKK